MLVISCHVLLRPHVHPGHRKSRHPQIKCLHTHSRTGEREGKSAAGGCREAATLGPVSAAKTRSELAEMLTTETEVCRAASSRRPWGYFFGPQELSITRRCASGKCLDYHRQLGTHAWYTCDSLHLFEESATRCGKVTFRRCGDFSSSETTYPCNMGVSV